RSGTRTTGSPSATSSAVAPDLLSHSPGGAQRGLPRLLGAPLANLTTGLLHRLKPYWLHLYLLGYTPLVLFADSRVANAWQQAGLGLLTFLLLFLCTRRVGPEARRQVWVCVLVATGFEVL